MDGSIEGKLTAGAKSKAWLPHAQWKIDLASVWLAYVFVWEDTRHVSLAEKGSTLHWGVCVGRWTELDIRGGKGA